MFQKVYILNGRVVFWPNRNLLTHNTNRPQSVQLTGPASRCLELLVSRRDLVTQHELFEYGWEGSGFTPSPNTLYQSISVLRRAFRELDNSSENYILTETRKGFRVNPNFDVIVEERAFSLPQESEALIPQKQHNPSFEPDVKMVGKKNRDLSAYLIVLLAGVAIAVGISFLTTNRFNKSDDFAAYKKISYPGQSECLFFLTPKSNKKSISNLDLSLLTCQDKPYNYLTTFSYSSKTSILSCNKEITKQPTDCSTIYLWGKSEH
ncbi:winged helix-turn-helix domain-containing protein [Lelliottia nimipressuralis]|uniref:winged helix-turn-helix domain-containing protein n=1 Tax=Lelliottia nimipressuralis TaxID=69220 RepID=UPI0028A29E1B|nr:winged helix-turn-helix domain-containing protein [Lelliottia nimipressuralis]